MRWVVCVIAGILAAGAANAEPSIYDQLSPQERAEIETIAHQLGMAPRDILDEYGQLTPAAEQKMASLGLTENDFGDGAGDAAQAQKMLDEYYANVAAMGQSPDPNIVAMMEQMVRDAGGAPKGNTGAATSPVAAPAPDRMPPETDAATQRPPVARPAPRAAASARGWRKTTLRPTQTST